MNPTKEEFNKIYFKEFSEFSDLVVEFVPDIRTLLSHHLTSFNYLIETEMPKIIMAQVNNQIQSQISPNFKIKYKKIQLRKPEFVESWESRRLYPQECRLRDLTYSGSLEVDLEVEYEDQGNMYRQFLHNIQIAQFPIMLGSNYCWLSDMPKNKYAELQECEYDPQGYFIIKGTEKVVLMQEQLCRNKIIVETSNKTKLLQATCASATLETKSKTNIVLKNNVISLKSSSFKDYIPLSIIFKAMGVRSDKQILDYFNPFLNQDELAKYHSKVDSIFCLTLEPLVKHTILTQEDAYVYLSSKIKFLFKTESKKSLIEKIGEVKQILQKITLPHIPCHADDYTHKVEYISLMVRKMLRVYVGFDKLEEGQIDIRNDRDYLGNKRIECSGDMLSLLFEDLFKRYNGEIKKEVDKHFLRNSSKKNCIENLETFIKTICTNDTITNGINHAITSGKWSIKRFKVDRQGVTQVLSRINYIGALGMLTRLESHIEKSKKVSGPRSLQCSHFGYICPVDTPDGENCGLVKNLALLTKVTTASDDTSLIKLLDRICMKELGLFSITDMNKKSKLWLVVVNGKVAGGVFNSEKFVKKFKEMRRKGFMDRFVSIFEDPIDMVIDIWSDGGRLVRPLINLEELQNHFSEVSHYFRQYLVQKNDKTKTEENANKTELKINDVSFYNFKDYLISIGAVEYLDVNELNNCNIAFSFLECKPSTTHIEISHDSLLGIVSSTIPYPHHNQSPRNTLQCAMGKQALGMSGLNQLNRIDTVLYQLVYPQRPFVETKNSRIANYHKIPAGQNATIVVMSYSGFDIEDAVIINKASIERGLGRAVLSRKYMVDLEKLDNQRKEVILPMDKNADGIANIAEKLGRESILVNKHVVVSTKNQFDTNFNVESNKDMLEVIPQVVKYKSRLPGSVHQILLSSSGEKYLVAKMAINQIRVPEVGDKFSSRHGQKGVMSLRVDQTNLPFSETGWTPDIIMNPHGFPSRMTIGKLLELVTGKAGALSGQIFTTSSFEDKTPCKKHQSFDCKCKSVMDNMGKIILEHGFEYMGTETLISGTTGEYISGYVFSGPVFYQRLKHLVSDKIHARATGKKTFLTRQPLEGRAKEGGLRLGEMERDCLVAYGATELLLERFLYSSDLYYCSVCEGCGVVSCTGNCGNRISKLRKIKMPYPFKLLLQELMSMNITPKILLK